VDNWDDWFQYSTMYTLIVFTDAGQRLDLGSVKIGQLNMKSDQRRPRLKRRFEALGDDCFSLGQSVDYYEQLGKQETPLRDAIVNGLRDVVAHGELFEQVKSEEVTRVSLMRFVFDREREGPVPTSVGRWGASNPIPVHLYAACALKYRNACQVALVEVCPESDPPTNVHVLIGRNGVGKTRMLDQ